MRKRLISFILTTVMVLSVNVTLPAKAISENYEGAYKFARAIDLFDETSVPKNELTRGEMARVICSMLNIMPDIEGEWYDEAFKESNSDVTVENFSTGLKYEDVKTTDDFYSYIKTVTGRGIMVGINETQFKPNDPMTHMQFIKVLLSMMGYSEMANIKGGYPDGYLSVMDDIGFYGLSGKDYNAHITVEEAAYIIYKNLDTPVASVKHTGNEGWNIGYSDLGLGEKILGIYKYTNRLNAIGNMSLYERENPDNTILVGDTLFKVSPGYEVDEKLFGREVNVYYIEEDGDVGPVIFAELADMDKSVSFAIDKLEDFTSESISYLDGSKIKTLKLKKGAYFISNGEQLLTYDKESFSFDYGEITIIQSKDEKAYDIIIVEGYNSVYVSATDSSKQIIYCKDRKPIDLSDDELKYKILKDGEIKEISTIEGDSIIDISESGKRIKINIPSKNKKAIKVASSAEEYGVKYITSADGEKFKIAKSFYKSSDYLNPKTGMEYTVILNGNGDIAWIEAKTTAGEHIGYFLRAVPDEEKERALIKILKEDGKTEMFTCVENLAICDSDGFEHKNVKSDAVKGYFKNADGSDYVGLIRYTLDKDGQIRKVEIPITNTNVKGEGKFYDLIVMNGFSIDTGYFTGWAWGETMFLNSAYTKAIFWPASNGDETKHMVVKYGKVPAHMDVKAKFYGTNPSSVEAEYMLYLNDQQSASEGYVRPIDFKTWAVVKERDTVYDEASDSVIDKLTIVTIPTTDVTGINEKEMTASIKYTDKLGQPCSILDLANDAGQSKDGNGAIRTYSIDKGDVIYYSADAFNEIKGLAVIYKADMKNPYAKKQDKPGWLAGTTDDYRSTNDIEKMYSNPYSFSSDQLLTSGLSYFCNLIRVHKVSPYKKDDNTYSSTSMDLNTYDWNEGTVKVEGKFKSHYLDGKRYPIFSYPYASMGLTVTITSNGNIETKSFTRSDIKPAEVYGKDCSTIIQLLTWSKPAGIIVINDER